MRFITLFSIIIVVLGIYSTTCVAQQQPNDQKLDIAWQYFNTKQYDGDKRVYTEADLYPPYALKGQANDSAITRYLWLLRNKA